MTDRSATPVLQRDHRSARGTIAYLSHKPDRYLQPRGREYFHIDVHSDVQRSIIAHCEIDDRPSVMRDITYSLDEQWLPVDCFVRITVGDRRPRRAAHGAPQPAVAHIPEPRDRVRRLAPAPVRSLEGPGYPG